MQESRETKFFTKFLLFIYSLLNSIQKRDIGQQMSYFFTFDILIKSNTKSLTLSKVCPVSLDHLRERATNSNSKSAMCLLMYQNSLDGHALKTFPLVSVTYSSQYPVFWQISTMACIHGLMTSLPPLNNGIAGGMTE